MFFGAQGFLIKGALTTAIGVCCVIGDQGLKHGKTALMRAFFDNFTHATVGGLTWTLILILCRKSLVPNFSGIIQCFLLSSFIDFDHFLTARSWKLDDATQLQKRPFLHCTTLPVVLCLILLLSAYAFNNPKLGYCSWIISASFLSHHIRDATRRGLWFCPLGSTSPLPYYLYLSLSMMLPYVLYWLMTLTTGMPRSDSNITVTEIV